jgi:hypothetical protein
MTKEGDSIYPGAVKRWDVLKRELLEAFREELEERSVKFDGSERARH